MAQFEKHYTVEEANRLIPELRELLGDVQSVRDHLPGDLQQAAPVLQAVKTNGGGKEAHAYVQDVQQINVRLRRLSELGIQLKDLDRGLVDFPAWRNGEEVFLCWHLGEDRVAFWHDLETGYAGREPLDS